MSAVHRRDNERTRSSPIRLRPGIGLRAALDAALVWLVVAIRRRRGRKELAELDDHLLRDIGLTGYDAGRKREKPFIEQR